MREIIGASGKGGDSGRLVVKSCSICEICILHHPTCKTAVFNIFVIKNADCFIATTDSRVAWLHWQNITQDSSQTHLFHGIYSLHAYHGIFHAVQSVCHGTSAQSGSYQARPWASGPHCWFPTPALYTPSFSSRCQCAEPHSTALHYMGHLVKKSSELYWINRCLALKLVKSARGEGRK